MATTYDGTQPRFRVDLMGPQGRVVSSRRIDGEDEAVRSFAELAKTDFGKELGRGSYVALVDEEQRLDAAKTHEGNGVYNMRFLREEGRAAYEAIQPSPSGVRYPVDIVETLSKTTLDRPQQRAQAPDRTSSSDHAQVDDIAASKEPAVPMPVQNEITAHQAQPGDDSKTASLRKQVLEELADGKAEPQSLRPDENVEWRDGTPFRRTVEPSIGNDNAQATRQTLARANQTELTAYAAARDSSPDVAQQVLGAARKRIESELEAPSGTRRSHPPLEDRFNIVEGSGSRTYQFRDQPGKVAFTERWLSMTTDSDHAAVVKAMVDRAEERGWNGMRVAGSEEFKRQAWIAAEARGIKAVGYEPTQSDRAASKQEELRLAKERPARAAPQQEAETGGTITRQGARTQSGQPTRPREDGRGESAGQPTRAAAARSYASVMGELERAMNLKGVPEAQRAGARNAIQKELDALARQDKVAKVKLYDPAASRQALRAVPRQQPQRAEPDRVR